MSNTPATPDPTAGILELHSRIDAIAEKMKHAKAGDLRKLLDNERKGHVRFTPEAQLDYLCALAACGRKGDSAGYAGVSIRSVQYHREQYREFAELEALAHEAYRDRIRAAIDEEGIEGRLEPIILRDGDGNQFIAGERRVRNPRILELAAKLNLPEFRERVEISGDVGLRVGVLAVGAAPADPNAWSDKHNGTRLLAERLDLAETEGKLPPDSASSVERQ